MTESASSLRRKLSAALGVGLLSAALVTGATPAHGADVTAQDESAIAAEVVELAERELGIAQKQRPVPTGASASVGLRSVEAPVEGSAVPEGHSVSGLVLTSDPGGVTAPAEGVLVELSGPWEESDEEEFDEDWVPDEDMLFVETVTAADGSYAFSGVGDGEYMLWFDPGEESIYWPDYVDVTVTGGDLVVEDMILTPVVPLGDLEARGAPVVGGTLEVVPSNWIAGTTLTYVWGWGRISGSEITVGLIDDARENSYTVTPEHIGAFVIVVVLAENPGYEPLTTATGWEQPISAPKKAPAPAPVSDSDDLGKFLVSHGATPQPQTSAGLPSGSLSPAKDYTAEVSWDGADSFVDVYAYSSPMFLGTFPVIDGIAQVELDADALSELGAGAHTIVLLGQSSGDVGSLRLSVAAMLAATGAEPVPGLAFGAVLLLLGAALVAVRRRTREVC